MTLETLAKSFFEAYPELSFGAVGPRENLARLPERVCGIPVTRLATEEHPHLPEQYLATNHLAFGKLSLLRWVLSDLFLMPGFIGALLCDAKHVQPELREQLAVGEGRQVIGAAYVAVPTLHPGRMVGASLMSFLEVRHCAAWAKTLTLKLWGARQLRGVTQWDNPALRVHTRLGPLRLVGRPPGGHEYADRTFVYETDLSDDAAWAQAMARKVQPAQHRRIPMRDFRTLGVLLDRAERGARIELLPPGIDDEHLLIRER